MSNRANNPIVLDLNDRDVQAGLAQYGVTENDLMYMNPEEQRAVLAGRWTRDEIRAYMNNTTRTTASGTNTTSNTMDYQNETLRPNRSRAYQYVYRAHHGASKGLTAKQVRHLYRYRPKKKVSPETRARIRQMGKVNGPALKRAKAIAKAANRKMTKQDFYAAGGTRPKADGGRY